MSDDFKIGDHWMISDRSGHKFRASEMRQMWNGHWVHHTEWEPRHPMDMMKAPRPEKPVRITRPRPTDTFIGPLTSRIGVAAAAGSTRITLDSAERYAAGDQLHIMLDNSETFIAYVHAVYDSTDIELVRALPYGVSVGNEVVNVTAMAEATI